MDPEVFHAVKGCVALLATVLLIMHMSAAWNLTDGRGQRLRYLTLLYFAVLITYASVEQAKDAATIESRHLGALLGVILLVVTMVVSIREHRARITS